MEPQNPGKTNIVQLQFTSFGHYVEFVIIQTICIITSKDLNNAIEFLQEKDCVQEHVRKGFEGYCGNFEKRVQRWVTCDRMIKRVVS